MLITSYKGNFEGGKVIHFEGSLAGPIAEPLPRAEIAQSLLSNYI